MADRIFINKDPGQYSERELNRVDWEQVRDGMLKAHKAANAGKSLNPFGMVTGLLDTRLAQFESDENPELEMPEEPGNESRIQMVADAVVNGLDLETEDAQFGLDNLDAVAAASGMMSDEVASTLQDFVGLNVGDEDMGTPPDSSTMGSDQDFDGLESLASRTAKKKLPAALAKFQFKKKDGDNPEKKDKDDEKEDKDEDGESDAMLRKGDERKANRKIVFTDAAQLSAAAVEAAQKAGDEELVRATLAARAERRVAIGQLAAEATLEQLTREAKSKRRAAVKSEKPKSEKPKEVNASVKTNNKTTGEDFVKPTELSSGQKSVFANKARELGFPDAYIEHMTGTRNANSVSEDDVRRVAEGPGDYKVKVDRVASMIREANLDEANRSRIIKFWVEELGYPSDYINKMVEDYKA